MTSKKAYSFDTFRLLYDTVLAYMFWSLMHALGPMIWFYPLNALDITGYEIFCVVCFSPCIFLCGEKVQKLFKHDKTMQVVLLLMLAGCASFQCSTTLYRLISLSIGVASALLLPVPMLWVSNHANKIISFWGYVLGFMALLSSRIWYTSITPLWNDYKTNTVLLTLFSIMVCSKLFFTYNQDDEVSSGKDKKPSSKAEKQKSSAKISETEKSAVKAVSSSEVNCIIPSLGFGGFIFLMHTIFGEVSVPSRYVVQGYPETGPMPNPYGGLILLSLTLGLFLSMHTRLSQQYLWSILGFASSMGLMFLPGWYGFTCGVFLAVYLTSVWSIVWENAIDCGKPGKTLCIGVLVYLLGIFGLVWCTAYNFVPFGGEYSRERTYVIIGLAMFFVGWSVTKGRSHGTELGFALNLPDMKYYTSNPTVTPVTPKQAFGKTVKKWLFYITLVGLLGFEYRNRIGYASAPKKINNSTAEEKHFSALIWTFHFGYDNVGWPSLERAADALEKTGADVITLLESDASKPYLGNNDIAMWLSERLNMYVDFGPSTRDHTWGNLLLSRYPFVKSKHHLLPSPHGELAPAVSATVNISGSLVDFVVTHMGNDRDDLDRQLQAQALSDLCANSENPIVFLGYVTSKPGSRDYQKLINDGKMKDIDATDRSRFCQYIFYRDLVRLGYARISNGGLSDTELQMARWQIAPNASSIKDRPKLSYEKDSVESSLRFSDDFGDFYLGHFWNSSHHYHMSTPKYFTF